MSRSVSKKLWCCLAVVFCLLLAALVGVSSSHHITVTGPLAVADVREIKSLVRRRNFEGLHQPGWSQTAPVVIRRGLSDLSRPITEIESKASGVVEVRCGPIGYALERDPNGWRIMKRMEKF
jgi:hypothetical protein